jgi:hypothetical protein
MDLAEKRAEWSRMLVQAAHFADLDNTIDALARARLCLKQIDEAIEALGDDELLSADRARAARRVRVYEKLHADWQSQTQARADAYVENEQRKYGAPLPKKGLD